MKLVNGISLRVVSQDSVILRSSKFVGVNHQLSNQFLRVLSRSTLRTTTLVTSQKRPLRLGITRDNQYYM